VRRGQEWLSLDERAYVSGQIAHDDDGAFFEGWDEFGLDLGFEDSV
jgi:hypothetical protein